MPTENRLLSDEEISRVINEAFTNTLGRLGTYVDDSRLENLFPGINLNDLNSYNFDNSRVRIFVFDYDTHTWLRSEKEPDRSEEAAAYSSRIRISVK